MPTLYQHKGDEGYYIRGAVFSAGIATWQVTEDGVAYLQRQGVQLGEPFSQSLMNELRQQGLIYTGKTGLGYNPLVPAIQIPNYEGPLLSLRIQNDEWCPAILFPELPGNWKPDPIVLGSCALQVNESLVLAALKLWPGKGGAFVEVPPQAQSYTTVPNGVWPSRWDMTRWLEKVPGLESNGTIFGVGENDPLRLEKGKGIALGSTYYLVVNIRSFKNKQKRPQVFPPTVRNAQLKPRGAWMAWKLDLPSSPDDELRKWAELLGHQLILPPWKVSLLSPPPYCYTVHKLPRLQTGQQAIFALYPPNETTTNPLDLKIEHVSESEKITKEIGTLSINKSVPQFFLANMDEPGDYCIRAQTGQLIPITVKVDSITGVDAISLQTSPLTVNVGLISQSPPLVAFSNTAGPQKIKIREKDLRLFKIQIECPTPITVSWESQGRANRREKIAPERFWQEVHADLISALENAESFFLDIDGGNFGRFNLQLSLEQQVNGKEPSRAANQMVTWLQMVLPYLRAQEDTKLVQIPLQVRTALDILEGEVTSTLNTETIPAQALPYFWFLVRESKA